MRAIYDIYVCCQRGMANNRKVTHSFCKWKVYVQSDLGKCEYNMVLEEKIYRQYTMRLMVMECFRIYSSREKERSRINCWRHFLTLFSACISHADSTSIHKASLYASYDSESYSAVCSCAFACIE